MRAYLLLNVIDSVDQQQFVRIMSELEETKGVEFVDPVSGDHDILVIVEMPKSIGALVTKLKTRPWLKAVKVLNVVSVFDRNALLDASWM